MRIVPRIHAVTSDDMLRSPAFTAALQAFGPGPAPAVHLRDREISTRDMIGLAERIRSAGLPVIVNDRADVTLAARATGIHLPSSGLPVARVREFVGSGVLVGRSTHSVADARLAIEEGADYVFLGPIWETRSHPGRPALGPDVIRDVAGGRVVAIGGINPNRAEVCAAAGAWGVAAITSIWNATEPSRVVAEMLLPFTGNVRFDHDSGKR